MNLCEKCRSEIEDGRHLPVFSVGGGTAGILGAAATGVPILVPLSLIAGILIDVERCSRCGAEMDEENPLYRPMRAEEDAAGLQTFTPHHFDIENDRSQEQGLKPSRNAAVNEVPYESGYAETLWDSESEELGASLGQLDENNDEPVSSQQYAWDELTATFIPTNENEQFTREKISDLKGLDTLPPSDTHFGILDEEVENLGTFDNSSVAERELGSLDAELDDLLESPQFETGGDVE